MFLAAPLLETRDIEPGYKEVKYSGTDCAGQNTDTLGVAVDAFAHHTLVDSQGTLVFVDLQGSFILHICAAEIGLNQIY